jgi:5-(carboxyamino)imidazole ribonucleotide synthase
MIGDRIGILGGGQLGRMLALAGYPLGLRFRFLDTSAEAPTGHLSELVTTNDFTDEEVLEYFSAGLRVATTEFENIPIKAALKLSEFVEFAPTPTAIEIAQDRLREKDFFAGLGAKTPRYFAINSKEDLQKALAELQGKGVLKTRTMGYDGKGQAVIKSTLDLDAAWDKLQGSSLILEEFIEFEREVSLIAVRDKNSNIKFYPLVENTHIGGILHTSLAPAPQLNVQITNYAESLLREAMDKLNYIGVLTVEFFLHGEELLFNEMAPRVHNSGHWTIEGAVTSQFENHLRAILNLPLGSTEPRGVSLMLNIISSFPDPLPILRTENAHLHLYGKTAREGRKLGHMTLVEKDIETILDKKELLR